jgi:hypothetical protein
VPRALATDADVADPHRLDWRRGEGAGSRLFFRRGDWRVDSAGGDQRAAELEEVPSIQRVHLIPLGR